MKNMKRKNPIRLVICAAVVVENAGLDNQILIDYIVEDLGGTIGDDYSDPYGQGRITVR